MQSQVGLREHHYTHHHKSNGGDGMRVELFHILKDDVGKVLHSICQQIRKTAVATGLEKGSFHSNPKETQCQTIAQLYSSHMLVK